MKIQTILLVIVFSLTSVLDVKAQFMNDSNGKPLMTKDYTNVEGSPYLTDNWSAGAVTFDNGKTFHELQIKYNEADDALYFKSASGEMLAFVDPVAEFTIDVFDGGKDLVKHYRNGYQNVKDFTEKAYFEVLADGNMQLLKKVTKIINETKDFNSASSTKTFMEKKRYYLVVNGKAVPVKNDKKSFLANMTSKLPQIEAFIKSNETDFKDDAALVKLVNYYNSL